MWEGLDSLEALNLGFNNIEFVHQSGFSNLPNLKFLFLEYNSLTTLRANVFNAADFPEGHQADLELGLGENPLDCDSNMCWLRAGWITWQNSYTPKCTNHPNVKWEDVNLDCSSAENNVK